jgi:ribonucleotide monophosphatase NagD (HAD superfamily)
MARKKTSEKICITLFKKYKSNALKRNLDFNLTIDDLWELFQDQKGKCSLTGVDIKLLNSSINNNYHLQTASLDRINNNLGYVLGNVRWVHKIVNSLKSDLSDEDLISLCHLISSKNPNFVKKNINLISCNKKRVTNSTITKMKNSNPHKKPIYQYDLDGNLIKEWNSINEARDFLKYKSEMGIIGTCKGRQKSSGGFIWKYKN